MTLTTNTPDRVTQGSIRQLGAHDDVGVVVGQAAVPVGHKVALHHIDAGSAVRKYGHVIGYATSDIEAGEHVHVHNLAYGEHEKHAHWGASASVDTHWRDGVPRDTSGDTFLGIRRADGRVATRNVIAVVATVNCSATVCQRIADAAAASGFIENYPGVDSVVPVVHTSGCGLASEGGNLDRLRRTLVGYATHVNVGGVLVISLGCEVNQIQQLLATFPAREDLHVRHLVMQELGGTRKTVAAGLEILHDLAQAMGQPVRQAVPVSELVLGLNCGGSDGWSGITANPALGIASDMIVAAGGRSVLAETPEIYGAEDLLLERAVTSQVADHLRRIITRWEDDVTRTGEDLDNNPSPGNKEGGITTILEKSLGAVAKGGHAPMSAVYEYAAQIDQPGFGFMDTPGYDPVSVTGLIAGGANVVVFTTGRGSALGYGIVPVIKVSTNTQLYKRMNDDMDLNAGDVITDGVTLPDKGVEIYQQILATASGQRTKSEDLGYGAHEFVPWLTGTVF